MSDSDDDYMSAAFLDDIQDVRPGIARSQAQKRALGICARSESAAEAMRARPKKADLEKIRREEALSKPVGEESKGFSLLSKMGYKPGMTLGKPKEGSTALAEPLELNMRLGRGGVGIETEEKEEQKVRVEAHFKQMKEIVEKQEELLVDYRKRKRTTIDVKQVSGDLWKMRKACQELDIQIGLDMPSVSWFWPIYKDRTGEIHEDPMNFKNRKLEMEEEKEVKYIYANGKESLPEVRIEDLDEDELADRLSALVEYLKKTHNYCHWCGSKFENPEELLGQCPGGTREAHDEF
ncbi:hypothetical protein FO519_006284 [Halicephalobus sp. NKZ332]|nr:hypothetical protein FO519_006284 [Halicephalobus sp. NKZ332]